MFTDYIEIPVTAGSGGNGVIRWRHEKFKPKAGPAGGDGGKGGDVYVRAVRDITVLKRYVGVPLLSASDGAPGSSGSLAGKGGEDLVIEVPVGSIVRDKERSRTVELLSEGEEVRIYKGGRGGRGNEHFKSSVDRAPDRATPGQRGEAGTLTIELSLVVDVGLVGLPNAGKSSLLNALTNARAKVGAYPFTTTSAELGDFHGFLLADIPGLIEGAAVGKGLGHTFLRHITRTKMILHVLSLDSATIATDYYTIRQELSSYNKELAEKEEWIILSKKDLINKDYSEVLGDIIDFSRKRVFVLSTKSGEGVKELHDALVQHLRSTYNTARSS